MTPFEKVLEKWNNGVLRGAQANLAKALGVSSAIVTLWTTGKRRPSKGYAAKMAQMFHLSLSQVLRLFPTSLDTFSATTAAPFLREEPFSSDNETEFLQPQSNSVSLPFLANVPAGYPEFDDSNIIEWWTLPRRYAKGAKYLVRCCGDSMEGAIGYDDLCLIKPETEFLEGKVMLVKIADGYVIKRIHKEKGKIVLFSDNNKKYKAFSPRQAQPIGVVVRKITDVE